MRTLVPLVQVWDRKPVYCVAVPTESAWVAGLNPGERDSAAMRPATPPARESGDERVFD